jgi:hypothetical protein
MTMKYSDVENAYMFVSMSPPDEHYAYLNKETGETYYVSTLGDSDELPGDLEENEKYISVPAGRLRRATRIWRIPRSNYGSRT